MSLERRSVQNWSWWCYRLTVRVFYSRVAPHAEGLMNGAVRQLIVRTDTLTTAPRT